MNNLTKEEIILVLASVYSKFTEEQVEEWMEYAKYSYNDWETFKEINTFFGDNIQEDKRDNVIRFAKTVISTWGRQ